MTISTVDVRNDGRAAKVHPMRSRANINMIVAGNHPIPKVVRRCGSVVNSWSVLKGAKNAINAVKCQVLNALNTKRHLTYFQEVDALVFVQGY